METILLIESEPADLVIQALILHCLGYNVLETANPSEALLACDGYPGPIHLVLARDAPDRNPFTEVVTRLKCRCPAVSTLLISDLPGERLPAEGAFLKKPFRAETLSGVIRELLARQRLMPAA